MSLTYRRVLLPLVIVSLSLTMCHPAQGAVSEEMRARLGALGIEVLAAGEIPYFSTGVGAETREVSYPPFSLKLVLANERGEYLSNVAVRIAPEGAASAAVEAVAKGPWFFVDLETGTYRVEATAGGVQKVYSGIRVSKGVTRSLTIVWP